MENWRTIQAISTYYVASAVRKTRQDQRGSITLEKAILIGFFVALAIALTVTVGALYNKYASKI